MSTPSLPHDPRKRKTGYSWHGKTLAQRFWEKVDRGEPDACWLWRAACNKDGYGIFRLRVHGSMVRAHQVAYQLTYGEVPAGQEIDHTCQTPPCVNPRHLEAVPHRINILRGNSPAAISARRDACKAGHPYTEDSSYIQIRPSGKRARICRVCRAVGIKKLMQARGLRQNPPNKLVAHQVRTIRELYPSGLYTYRALANLFNLRSPSSIRNIISGKSWKNDSTST